METLKRTYENCDSVHLHFYRNNAITLTSDSTNEIKRFYMNCKKYRKLMITFNV